VGADYRHHAARLDARPDVQAFNAGRTDAVQTVLRSYGTVRSLVIGQYGEASADVHELLELCVEAATSESWRYLGARSMAEARSYFASTMRRTWGVLFVREFARHRVRRICYIGAGHRPRAAQASGAPAGVWEPRSASEFHAYSVRRAGAVAGLSARRGWPRRA